MYEVNGGIELDRKIGSGRPIKLKELEEDKLRSLVLKGPRHFVYETDLWTVSRLRRVITG